jgi:phage shock protein PspC (stress-responsive transcriptional regulator)
MNAERRDPSPAGKEPLVASTLTRPRDGRIIAGVCAGLAQRFGWSVFVVRLLFLLSIVLPGSQVIVYLILWFLMPNQRDY